MGFVSLIENVDFWISVVFCCSSRLFTWTRSQVQEQFRSSVVCHYTDLQAMAILVTKGSKNVKLHPMVVDAPLALRKYGNKVEAVWRSREDGLIQLADKGSTDFHSDNILCDFVIMKCT